MTQEVLFKLIIELIVALSYWLWPLVTLLVFLTFRKPITALLGRVKKGEIFGQGFELEPAVDEFQESVQQAEEEVAQLPAKSESPPDDSRQTDIEVNQILDDSKGSPELALIRLSNILENESKTILGSLGLLPLRPISVYRAIEELEKRGFLPKNTIHSLKKFWELRNKIVHGRGQVDEKEILRVLDLGIVLLKTIRAIPHDIHVVQGLVDVYEDAECKHKRPAIKGVILESTSPSGERKTSRIVHTTKTSFQVGKRVTWEWDLLAVIPVSWYIDPANGEKKMLESTLDFAGRLVDNL